MPPKKDEKKEGNVKLDVEFTKCFSGFEDGFCRECGISKAI